MQFKDNGKTQGEWREEVRGKNDCYSACYQELFDTNGKEMGYFFVFTDETENVRKYEEEKYKATHDGLTGLLNKDSFFQKVDDMIAENPNVPRYMIVSDIMDFKLVNNIYGEDYGNQILQLQAKLVKSYQTQGNVCGRIAGDKFAMLLSKDKYNQEIFAEAIGKINEYTNMKKFVLHFHIGIYDITGLTETAKVLYNRTVLAISTIHEDYEKTFVEYNHGIMNRLLEKKALISYFDRALEERQFCMYLQPQMDRDGQMTGAEALVRWQHPEKGLIFPDSFIGVLEEAGLIHKLDLEMWNMAAEKLAEWEKRGKNDIHPENLKLEITESAVMTDKKNNFATLSRLKQFGFELELDDFGSGYSSLNMLKDFRVDVLKIDRIFLRETEDMEKSRIILESVFYLAQKLGMKVVTEGVETKDQVNSLLGMGCNYFQGYYFDKPISVKDFEEKYMEK